MCQQLEVLEKIRQVGEMNGYAIDLAEAQAKDYIRMNKKVSRIEKDVLSIKKEQIKSRDYSSVYEETNKKFINLVFPG